MTAKEYVMKVASSEKKMPCGIAIAVTSINIDKVALMGGTI